MQGLKKVLLGAGLMVFSGITLAQDAPKPRDVSIPQPAGPASPAGVPTATVDLASRAYLPWIGENERLLVNYADLFYQLEKSNSSGSSGAYMATITALANNNLATTSKDTLKNSTSLTLTDVQKYILAFGDDATLNSTSYAMLNGTDVTQNSSDDFSFNADNILGVEGNTSSKLNYAIPVNGKIESDKDSVNTLVMFLGGAAQPLGGLTFSTDPETLKKQLAGSDVQSYLLQARTAAAGQSVALSNLNYLAQERMIVKDLGKKAGYSQLPTPTDGSNPQNYINDASQLQIEKFLVDRRVGNSSWYTSVNNASSITVQRETLYVLAEISKQLFEQKLLMERMLAGQVAMQVQTAQLNKTKLDYDRSQVQQNLSSSS